VHAQQGVKQLVLSVCLSVTTKIARSRDLDIWSCRKHSESIETFEKFASCFESFDKAHERRNRWIFVGHAYQPHPHVLSAHAHNLA
jgi:hypothetical protein